MAVSAFRKAGKVSQPSTASAGASTVEVNNSPSAVSSDDINGVLTASQLPATVAYTDAANNFSGLQTLNGGADLNGNDVGNVGLLECSNVNVDNTASALDFAATGTGANVLPAGTTAQRPGSPVAGDIRFNSTLKCLEVHDGTEWSGTEHAPTWQNGWASYSSPYPAPKYRRDAAGRTQWTGLADGGSATGTQLCVAPAGFRPPYSMTKTCWSSSGAVPVTVLPTGEVLVPNGVVGYLYLDGLSYLATQ